MYIRFELSLRDHPKIIKAARTLGIPKAHFIGHLGTFWLWCLLVAPDGDLSSFDEDDIEWAAEWNGKKGAFVEQLKSRRLLDISSEGIFVHNWEIYAEHLKARERKRKERERKKSRDVTVCHVTSQDVTGRHRTSRDVTNEILPVTNGGVPCHTDQNREDQNRSEQNREEESIRARTREETFTQNFLKSKKENPKPDQASGDVPESILAAQRKLEEARERLKLDRERERERIEVETDREDSTAIGDIINSFSSNVYTIANNSDQSDEIDHSDNVPKRPLGSDSSEIDWTIARDIFSAIRSRYGHGSYKPTGYGKYSDSLSDVASWANAESGEWTARELVELSAAGFVVSANEKTKEAKYHPGFWWGDPGAHLQAGLNELKKWELEIVVSELTEAKFTKPKTDEVMRKIETLIKQRDRIEESLSFSANRAG